MSETPEWLQGRVQQDAKPLVYQPALKPFAHQREALALMAMPENSAAFALFMGMRTGKTKTLLDDWGRRELVGDVQDLFVVAPGGVYKTWRKASLGDNGLTEVGHLSDDLKRRVLFHDWTSGANKSQKQALGKFLEVSERPRIFTMNVEALATVKEAREAAKQFLRNRKSMVAIDESTIIKNPSSKRTKFINTELAEMAEFRRILSGLPNPKDPLDYYSQMEFLDWRYLGFRSWYAMRGRYAVMRQENIGGRLVPIVMGWRDLDELEAKISKHCFRKRLQDCHDVPDKAYLFKDVELTPEQRRIYNDLRDFATAQLDEMSHVTATVVIAQITRLSQVLAGYTIDEQGKFHEIPETRTKAILELLEEYDGKAIIWCAYGDSIERVAAALRSEYGERAVACFWGGNQKEREDEERRFKTEDECRFMVATAAAGGRGRTWHVADLIIYHSNTEDLEHRDQSEERGSAVGKGRKITVVDLRAPGTVDEKKINNLRKKIDLATAVNGEGYRAWLI